MEFHASFSSILSCNHIIILSIFYYTFNISLFMQSNAFFDYLYLELHITKSYKKLILKIMWLDNSNKFLLDFIFPCTSATTLTYNKLEWWTIPKTLCCKYNGTVLLSFVLVTFTRCLCLLFLLCCNSFINSIWLLLLLFCLLVLTNFSFPRANAQQPKLFVGMILILIFAEALALYGLIVGIILSSRAGQSRAD